jgi:hypothetical protein
MKAISVQNQQALGELVIELDSCAEGVRNAVVAFNAALTEPRRDVEAAITEHNSAAAALKEYLGKLAMMVEEHLATRPERWQETDEGAAYAEWVQSLAEAAGSVCEIDEDQLRVEELSEPELFDADGWVYPANAPRRIEENVDV